MKFLPLLKHGQEVYAGFGKRLIASILDMVIWMPVFFIIELFYDVWYWSEIIVILFNKRNRALHDFLAGTVVIHKKYA